MSSGDDMMKDFLKCVAELEANSSKWELIEALACLITYISNLLEKPNEPKYRSIRYENKHFIDRFGRLKGQQWLWVVLSPQ